MFLYRAFQLETRRILRNKIVLGIICLFIVALASIQFGIVQYKGRLAHEDLFKDIENKKVSLYQNYTQYGTYGFRVLFVSAPLSVFFVDSGVFSEITANIDSGERLNIYTTFKGPNIFKAKKKPVVVDFSGILLFFGGLLAIFYGYSGVQERRYLRFFTSLSSRGLAFTGILGVRLVIITLLLALLLGAAFLLCLLNGIILAINSQILFFFFTAFLVLVFFTVLGLFLGTRQRKSGLKSRVYGTGALMTCLVIFIFVIPTIVNFIMAGKANKIKPLYNLEMEKLAILMDFEKKAREDNVTYNYNEKLTKPVKERVKEYYNNEFLQIHGLEEELRAEMRGNVSFYHVLSMCFPTTYYLATTEELSGCGYVNLLDFHSKCQELKKEFFKFYMMRLYFMGNFSQVVNFISGDENIYRSESRLPGFFWLGPLLTLVYTGILIALSYRQFNRLLDELTMEDLKWVNPSVFSFKKGELEVHHSAGWIMPVFLYGVFSGGSEVYRKNGFDASVKVDDREYFGQRKQECFYYICRGEDLPQDVVVEDFIALVSGLMKVPRDKTGNAGFKFIQEGDMNKRIFELEDYKQGELMLYCLGNIREGIVLIDGLSKDMPIEFLEVLIERMKELSGRGVLVLNIYSDMALTAGNRSIDDNQLLMRSELWLPHLETMIKSRKRRT